MSTPRRTIAKPATFNGVGLFTAINASLTIHPNHDATGILFKIHDQLIPADIHHLSAKPVHPAFAEMSPRCTSLCAHDTHIATTEHLLSALVGLGITDAIIKTDAPEIPILDGSALPFVQATLEAGIAELSTTVEPIVVHSPITVRDGDASITIEPAQAASYSYTIDYGPDSPIAGTTVVWNAKADSFTSTIAPARTFCLQHEADAMHAAGLFTHLSTSDMLVIGPDGPIDNTLRHEHECALHKLLDLIGDLALVGRPLVAKVIAHKSGHAMNHQAARKIIEQLSE